MVHLCPWINTLWCSSATLWQAGGIDSETTVPMFMMIGVELESNISYMLVYPEMHWEEHLHCKWHLMMETAMSDGQLMLFKYSRWQSYLFSDELYPAPHWKKKPNDLWRQQTWGMFVCVRGQIFLFHFCVCVHTQPLVALNPDGGRRDEAVWRLCGGCFRDFCQVLFTLLFHWLLWVLVIVVLIGLLCGEQHRLSSQEEEGS